MYLSFFQERIALWHEQNNRYNSDLKEFRQQAADLLEKLGKEHSKLRSDMEGAGARVDRVEREMDYIETKNPPKPCVKAADKMVEQDPVFKESKKEDFFELSGESGKSGFESWSPAFDHLLSVLALTRSWLRRFSLQSSNFQSFGIFIKTFVFYEN